MIGDREGALSSRNVFSNPSTRVKTLIFLPLRLLNRNNFDNFNNYMIIALKSTSLDCSFHALVAIATS